MRTMAKGLGIIVGGLLFAAALYMLLALPGLVSDRDSTVPVRALQQV